MFLSNEAKNPDRCRMELVFDAYESAAHNPVYHVVRDDLSHLK